METKDELEQVVLLDAEYKLLSRMKRKQLHLNEKTDGMHALFHGALLHLTQMRAMHSTVPDTRRPVTSPSGAKDTSRIGKCNCVNLQ